MKKIADLLINGGYDGIEIYKVAASFIKFRKNTKLDRLEFNRNKDYYIGQVENRLKTLRKRLESKGYTIKRQQDILKIVEI